MEATLLRDRDNPHRFLSFGVWRSFEAIECWRQHAEFQAWVARVGPFLGSLTPATLREVPPLSFPRGFCYKWRQEC